MVRFSALLGLCEGNPTVTGVFPSQRPVARSFDVVCDLRLNKQLNKQSRRRWFVTPSRSLWRHCNVHKTISNHTESHFLLSKLLHSPDYSGVTWVSYCLKSPTTGLFVQHLVQTNNKDPTLLAIWEGNPLVRGGSQHKNPEALKTFRCLDVIITNLSFVIMEQPRFTNFVPK